MSLAFGGVGGDLCFMGERNLLLKNRMDKNAI